MSSIISLHDNVIMNNKKLYYPRRPSDHQTLAKELQGFKCTLASIATVRS